MENRYSSAQHRRNQPFHFLLYLFPVLVGNFQERRHDAVGPHHSFPAQFSWLRVETYHGESKRHVKEKKSRANILPILGDVLAFSWNVVFTTLYYSECPQQMKNKWKSQSFTMFLVYSDLAITHTKVHKKSTKPGLVNSLKNTVPKFARPDSWTAHSYVNVQSWTLKWIATARWRRE